MLVELTRRFGAHQRIVRFTLASTSGSVRAAIRPKRQRGRACDVRHTADILPDMSFPRAYLLTWTSYGTWLHGDDRGSVDADHNVPDTPYVDPDLPRQMRSALRQPRGAVTLDAQSREIVHQTVIEHCEHRGWELLGLNVRSNHVHAIVSCGEVPPETVLSQLKAWSTRRLRAAGVVPAGQKIWTEHGSTRYLWDARAVRDAGDYVAEGQGPYLQ